MKLSSQDGVLEIESASEHEHASTGPSEVWERSQVLCNRRVK